MSLLNYHLKCYAAPRVLLLALASGIPLLPCAVAQESPAVPASSIEKVEVHGKPTDRDQRDYHDALKGIDVFNQLHALAPQAELHFRLYPRSETLRRDDVQLHLKSDSVQKDIELSPDWIFDVPRDVVADEERGALVTNRAEKSFAWRPSIRSPGIPANARRLGDLRLECRVDVAANFFVIPPTPANLVVLPLITDPCAKSTVHYVFFADQPVFGVTLVNKERRLPLQTAVWLYANRVPLIWRPLVDVMLLDDRVYEVPLADTDWPDDTLVEFEFIDEAKTTAKITAETDGQPASMVAIPSASEKQ